MSIFIRNSIQFFRFSIIFVFLVANLLHAHDRSIAVIGVGSIGKVIASHFSQLPDVKVVLVVRNKEANQAISQNGIEIFDEQGNTKVYNNFVVVPSIDDLDKIEPAVDTLIVSTKATELEIVGEAISRTFQHRKAQNPIGIILAQNGIGNEEKLSHHLHPQEQYKMMRWSVRIAAENTGLNGSKINLFPPLQDIGPEEVINDLHLDTIVNGLIEKGMKFNIQDRAGISRAIWNKGIANSIVGPLSVISHRRMKDIFKNQQDIDLARVLIDEAVQVANAEQIHFSRQELDGIIDFFVKQQIAHFPSMYTDIQEGKKPEIGFMNAKIAELGKRHHVETPFHSYFANVIETSQLDLKESSKKLPIAIHRVPPSLIEDNALVMGRITPEIQAKIKLELNKVIQTLSGPHLNFSKRDFLSDNVFEIGNLGTADESGNYDYVLSDEAPIRVKVNAIINSVYDSTLGRPRSDTASKLITFIMNEPEQSVDGVDTWRTIMHPKFRTTS